MTALASDPDWGRGVRVIELADGGYVLACNVLDPGSKRIARILRTDPSGEVQWRQEIAHEGNSFCCDVLEMVDGDLLLTGAVSSPDDDLDILIARIGKMGGNTWEKAYGGNMSDCGTRIAPVGNNEFLVMGRTSIPSRGYDTCFLRIDGTGNVISNVTYGGDKQDFPNDMVRSPEGGYVVVGWTDSFGVTQRGTYLLKVSPNDELIWEEGIDPGLPGTYSSAQSFDVAATANDYLAVGTFNGTDAYIAAIDQQGNITWEMFRPNGTAYCVAASDSGYLIGGCYKPKPDESKAYILKLRKPKVKK